MTDTLALLTELEQDIAEQESSLEVDCAARDRLVARIQLQRQALAQLKGQQGLLKVQALADTNWEPLLASDSPEVRKLRGRLLAEAGFSTGGEWLATGQTAIRFMLYRGRPSEVERACLFVRQVLPYIKPHPDGTKWLGVFEHSLSFSCRYHVSIDETTQRYRLQASRGSREETVFESDTLEALVQYVHDRHYYEVFRSPEDPVESE